MRAPGSRVLREPTQVPALKDRLILAQIIHAPLHMKSKEKKKKNAKKKEEEKRDWGTGPSEAEDPMPLGRA